MNNEEEKRCPLCAEEMDWTDQQFMPCKCGYQVCVWCWHHIIDMAEKDEAEGRCPACRTIYEKEKIVAMQANSERTMSKVSNRKTKPPKGKPKIIEVKKDLTNIRVIQRKMVYVIGLPLSLADEAVLRRKEYFGQYGKVTKVSLSRTAGGTIQLFMNDTCSVYITYSTEEEALQCIQSIHGFVLEGRFLRASFGTAKYCHAWLKNMACNNRDCLYLHSVGADEDSFGKDEVAAVHTRSRVHQIVGDTNNVIKRSGTVLPPVDDVHISCSTFSDKSTTRHSILDATYASGNSTTSAVPHKMTTFVDIVGRSSSAAPEKDGNNAEDRRILDLCSEISSITVDGETHAEEPYSVKIPSANHVANALKLNADEPLEEGSFSYHQGSKDTYSSRNGASFCHPFYSSHYSEDSGVALLQNEIPSVHGFTVDRNLVNNQDDEASLPIRRLNSVTNDSFQEMKFQNSVNSDRIYRGSQSFSNEEIIEHLRRIDGDDDDNLHRGEENPALDAVERIIVSDILSIDFDSCKDSLPTPNGLPELVGEADRLGGSSWSSLNSDHSGYSFAKQVGLASQHRDNKERYACKPQYPVSRGQGLAPPGFSMPSRDPPPGFSNVDRTGCLPRPSSVGPSVNASSISSPLFQPSLVSLDDFYCPAILPSNRGKQTNGLNTLEDDSRFWRAMQHHPPAPTHQDSEIVTSSQPKPSFAGHHNVNGMSRLDNGYGLSSRRVENCDASFFSQMPQQRYADGHVSNSNSYLHSLDGDLMLRSGDVYTRLFGL